MKKKRKKRDTYIYQLKEGRKIVYVGITNNPNRRAIEHDNTGKEFTHVLLIRGPMSRERAEKLEKEYIQKYKRGHKGKPPRYNKNKTT